MKYIDEVLVGDEKVTYETGLHWIIYAPTVGLFIAAVLCVSLHYNIAITLFLLISGLSLVRVVIRQMTTEISVTTRRIIFKRGWISRNTIELNLTGLRAWTSINRLPGASLILGRSRFEGPASDQN
jgi:uncharacterized membrane protein